ncbi:MAG TPA: threonine synthase [Thermoanaerobaculia bacterium]|nr:threonine synthase [Thermoanaerobaculia bacterium]
MILHSTRDTTHKASFAEALIRNLAPDGGLYIPERLEPWPDVEDLLALSWPERCTEILVRLIGDEYDRAHLAAVTREAFNLPVPITRLDDRISAVELFHGPTLAFKDFGARFLARMLHPPRTILTATSGDTGAAVARAFWKLPGIRAVVLYPQGRVSPLQEKQFASLGDNVLALAVEGSFDDCQALAKACFADRDLSAALGLTSANSINIARLLAQTLYYFEAVAQHGGRPVIAVPSGNFGNLCAGLIAHRLGLPVRAFVAATNANTVVPEYLETGLYRPRPSVATLSNAMDVGAPSNWERIESLFQGDWQALRGALRWGSLDEEGTRKTIRDLDAGGYLCDPHGAVAYAVLSKNLQPGETGLFLATANPAKFKEALEPVLGREIPLPPALREVAGRPLLAEVMPVDMEDLKRRLRKVD